jgi:hypothetical protein
VFKSMYQYVNHLCYRGLAGTDDFSHGIHCCVSLFGRDGSGDCSIDLHGLTVNESIIVTKEILDHWPSSNSSGR